MTIERAKEVIERYHYKHGKQEHNFIILANEKDGIYTYYELLEIIKEYDRNLERNKGI